MAASSGANGGEVRGGGSIPLLATADRSAGQGLPNFGRAGRVPGNLDLSQAEDERLVNDPHWTHGCWAVSYVRYHNYLVARAREVQEERSGSRRERQAASGQDEVTMASSMKLLRDEVFSLCPLLYLGSGVLISFVLTALSFLTPYAQGVLVDAAVGAYNAHMRGEHVDVGSTIGSYLAVIGLLSLASYLCEIAVGILFAICGHTTVTRLRIKLFRNLTVQEIAFYDAHVSGELSSRLINDSAALSSLTQFTTQTLLGAIVKFAGSLVAMYLTHPLLALVATVITPVSTYIVRRTGMVVGHYGVVQNDAMAKANAVAIEVLGSIRTVHSNVGEIHEANVFMQKLNYYLRVIKATVYLETVLRFTFYGMAKARNLVVLAVAMNQVIFGMLSIGAYTAFASYVTLYEDGFKNLADIWINFRQTITSTGKFVQLLLRVPEISLEGGRMLEKVDGALCFEDVIFEYRSRPGAPVLNGISFSAVPGDIVALVGESGAGKSTIGRLLQRYYDPVGGRILLDGIDYRDLDLRWLRSQIGFVEQEPVLFDRSISENIAYGSAQGKPSEAVEEAAKLANAHDFITKLATAYETRPGERAARISGGQKQRIAIARSIIRSPHILVLDEATSALDSENEHIVQVALDNLMVGKTTVIIAHRLSTIVRATSILVLEKGRVIEQGTHEELVADEGSKYSSFMRHQLVKPLLE